MTKHFYGKLTQGKLFDLNSKQNIDLKIENPHGNFVYILSLIKFKLLTFQNKGNKSIILFLLKQHKLLRQLQIFAK